MLRNDFPASTKKTETCLDTYKLDYLKRSMEVQSVKCKMKKKN